MEPFLSTRRDGIYIIRYCDATGREHSKSTGSRSKLEALRALAGFSPPSQGGMGMTVEELAALYKAHATVAPSTLQTIKDVLKPFLERYGDLRLQKLTPLHFDEYRTWLSKGRSRATVLLHLRQLRPMFRYAVERDFIRVNPMHLQKNLNAKVRHPMFLAAPDFDKLWRGLSTKWHKDLVALAILTGLRRKELVALTWADVDSQERTVRVLGKGDRERTVALAPQAMLILAGMERLSEYLFITEKGTPPELHYVSRMFARARKRAGIDPRVHLHSLRHSFATWALSGGGGLQGIQQMMGHASLTTTLGYTHPVTGEMREVADHFPEIPCIKSQN